jgi:hypothetical protein
MSNPTDSPPLPDWAFQHARASLRIGLKVPEIEQRLVARGLAPEAATSVVTKALEDRIREENEPKERAGRRLRMHRILSAVLVGAYILVGYRAGGVGSALYTLRDFLLPLVCIWFADEMESATGPTGILSPYLTFPTPAIFLRLGGWLVLLAPCIFIFSAWIYLRLWLIAISFSVFEL